MENYQGIMENKLFIDNYQRPSLTGNFVFIFDSFERILPKSSGFRIINFDSEMPGSISTSGSLLSSSSDIDFLMKI